MRLSAKKWRGPITDHFNGKVFFHGPPFKNKGFFDVLKWMGTRAPAIWPNFVETRQHPHPPGRHHETDSVRITFINHATVLIQTAACNILTDPLWSERTSPVRFAGPKRVIAPGVALNDLPAIDIILLSHNHYDHMDLDTLAQLQKRFHPKILTGLGNTEYLRDRGINDSIDMDWWDQHSIASGMNVTFVPAQHFSSRGLSDRNRTLWGGFVVKTAAGSIFFAGDTGYGPHFKEIAARCGPMQVSLLPIGAYEPRWFMGPVHMNPEDAVLAHLDVQSKYSLGIHFGAFQLTDEARDAPLAALDQARLSHGISSEHFFTLDPGEGRTLIR